MTIAEDLSKYKIKRLRASDAWIRLGKMYVVFEALIVDKNNNPVEGVTVDFYDQYPLEPKATRETDENGKAAYRYEAKPTEKLGKEKQIWAQIKGTAEEVSATVELFPYYGKDWITQYREFIKENWMSKKVKIIKHLVLTFLIFVPALILLFVIPKVIGFGIGLVVGLFMLLRAERKNRGFIKLVIAAALGYFLGKYAANVLAISIGVVFFGEIFYALEELTYQVKFTQDPGRKKLTVEWLKTANFYPWWWLLPIATVAGVHFFGIAATTLDLFSFGKFESMAITGPGIPLDEYAVSGWSFLGQSGLTILWHIKWIISLTLGALIISLYSAPGELIGALSRGKKTEEYTTGSLIEKLYIWKELLTDIAKRKPI